ncbi:uncharacterized protein [Branchiostoma lanceolatum]|uniref:uncharacterized protein isoform X2 n=1 Tax=Branchiostoma lanceolatum TaxID=7740 RepID=UPI003454392D
MDRRRIVALFVILLASVAFVCGQQNTTSTRPTEGATESATAQSGQVILLLADREKRRISSPGYPDNPYPNDMSITWRVAVNHSLPGDNVVHLEFDHFELEEEPDCVWDYVAVYDGINNVKGKFCGNAMPPEIESSSNNMSVVFISDSSATFSGFSARYWANHSTGALSEINVALHKRASQSSLLRSEYPAERAVDGNTGTILYPRQECTHTGLEYEPWWKVDLGDTYVIGQVTVINRGDCCGERLRNFMVRVGLFEEIRENTPCGSIYSATPSDGQTIDVRCAEPISGRWVSVQLIGREDYLSLCEVQVYTATGDAVTGMLPDISQPTPPEFKAHCKDPNLDFSSVTIPNFYGHRSVEEILASRQWQEMKTANTSCHPQIRPFPCSLLIAGFRRQDGLPCQSWCWEVRSSCSSRVINGSLFEAIACESLPPTRCVNLRSPQDCYYGNGVNYRGTGTLPVEGGKTCHNWTEALGSRYTFFDWADLRENYCRNLSPDYFSEPFCVVTMDTMDGHPHLPETCGLKPCGERGCGPPPVVRSGSRSPVQNFYKTGEKVFIRCDKGYTIEVMWISCTGDGTWSTTELQCVVNQRLRLQNALLASGSYSRKLAPHSHEVSVVFRANLEEIIDADEKNENMFASISFRLQWMDSRLSWIPYKYGDLSELVMETTDVWIPKVYLQRNGDARFGDFPDAPVTVTSDGLVTWDIIDLVTTTCNLKPALFPFDSMECPVCLGGRTGERFYCNISSEEIFVAEPQSNIKGFKACGEGDVDKANQWNARWTINVTEKKGCIIMKFDRIPTFHLCTTLFPAIILTLLMCITFVLPIDKGDRLSFGMTILLSMVVSLVFITDVLPAKGSMPVVAILIIVYMCMMGFFLIVTVMIIRVSSSDKNLPPLVKKVFLRYVARLVFLGDLTQRKHGHTVLKVDDFEMMEGMKGKDSKPSETEPRHLLEVLLSLKDSVNNLSDAVESFAASGQPQTTKATEDEAVKTDYGQLAKVLDRLCLFLYVFGLIIAIPIVRFSTDEN